MPKRSSRIWTVRSGQILAVTYLGWREETSIPQVEIFPVRSMTTTRPSRSKMALHSFTSVVHLLWMRKGITRVRLPTMAAP